MTVNWMYFVKSIILPLIFSALICVIAVFCGLKISFSIPIFFGLFTLITKCIDFFSLRYYKLQVDNNSIAIHKEYAIKEAKKIINYSQKTTSAQGMRFAIDFLEEILINMIKCCSKENDGNKIETFRANLNNLKVQLLKPNPDVKEIYSDIIEEVSALEYLLKKM